VNLQPLTIDNIPIGVPLPWQIFDRYGYTVFSRGEVVAERKLLENLIADGLLRDMDMLPQADDAPDWLEIENLAPSEMFPPQGIKPQIWERVQLRLLGRDAQAYYTARLIGYIKDKSILVATPEHAGQRIDLAEGEMVEVRMLTGGNIYVFQSAIQRLCISPVHYLHLEYPARVRMQKLRRSPWARVDLAALITAAQGREEFGHILNLSPDGAQLNVPVGVGVKGEMLRLTCHVGMDELKTTLVLDAAIQHVHPAKAGGGMLEYRVEFHNLQAHDALWLRGLVYQRIAEGYPA